MLSIVGNTYTIKKNFLEKVARAAFSFLDTDFEVELKFVSIREITRLNSVYRGVNSPTDVLSFNISEKPLLGQVFICYNFTKEQAKKVGKSFEDETALLLVHGILHVAGYDHAELGDEARMQDIEKRILERVGIRR